MITLTRRCSYADAVRQYLVIIDGNEVGHIKQGESFSYADLTSGSHVIWLKIDWCRSNKIEFEYLGDDILFECGSSLSGIKLFLAIIYLFMPTKWCWIRKIETEQCRLFNSLHAGAEKKLGGSSSDSSKLSQ